MPSPSAKTTAYTEVPTDSSLKPLIFGLLIAAVLVLSVVFSNPRWLSRLVTQRTTLLLVMTGMVAVFLVALLVRIRDLRLIRKELARARETAVLAEHERDQAQQELVLKLQQERELEREKLQFQS